MGWGGGTRNIPGIGRGRGHLKGTRMHQTELMVEICSKSLVRPIGEVLLMKFSKTHKVDEKWPLFVNKQLFWWSASITLDNNNAVLTDL